MLMKSTFYFLLFVSFLAACNSNSVLESTNNTSNTNFNRQLLVGSWDTALYSIKVESLDNTLSSIAFNINKKDFEEKLQLTSVNTVFNENGTYHSQVVDAQKKILKCQSGKWKTENNKLIIHQECPREKDFIYDVNGKGNILTFFSHLDFDVDGCIDDSVCMMMIRSSS